MSVLSTLDRLTSSVSVDQRLAWLHPGLKRCPAPEKFGDGVFALQPIAKGTLLMVFGGAVVDTVTLQRLGEFAFHRSIQVEEGLHLTSGEIDDPADCINHSCDPNAGLSGQIAVVAMRDIAPGEEACFDYAMCDGEPDYCIPCHCGSSRCRGQVTGNDWRLPELQACYAGYFSPYLQRRINALKKARRLARRCAS